MIAPALSLLTLLALHAAGGAAAPASTAIMLPEGLPDGHYEGDGSIDPATGFSRYTYVGPIDYEAVANYTAAIAAASTTSTDALVRRATVNCNGRSAGDSTGSVQNAFASNWDGKDFSGKWAKTTQGSSQAYACNYGGKQTIHKNDYLSNMGSVNSVCGSSNSGWFEHPEWKLNYGRDNINAGIC
ncbi:hypothetical protein B0H67DRAFT_642202 [Lasiosphaeris hirsuta]|uniref:Secreted protein n=1 Tax=Lasiosphaeris hirsuta TaxID=260670 RepID=A0AA40B187_9PEZI|nr:hypothetical protein B0H67DRAFT_642202 [Lasiosphaeris hirsuta]